jgi:hypothetical protein
MSRRGGLSRRPVLLAAAAALSVGAGHLLASINGMFSVFKRS